MEPQTYPKSTRPSISSLPPELHDKIWFMTFEPQTISIYLHIGRASGYHPGHVRTNTPASIIFTASLGAHAPLPLSIRHDQYQGNPRTPSDTKEHPSIPLLARSRPPPGPIALQVSRQSRTFALRHYELAFSGINLVPGTDVALDRLWDQLQLSQKRTWIDFKRDVVFFHNAGDQSSQLLSLVWPWGYHPFDLGIFVRYAEQEVKKIHNLAISGEWYNFSGLPRNWVNGKPYSDEYIPIPPLGLRPAFALAVKEFRSLKDILVHNKDSLRTLMRPLQPLLAKQDLMYLKEVIERLSKDDHVRCHGWGHDTPEVTILKACNLALDELSDSERNDAPQPSQASADGLALMRERLFGSGLSQRDQDYNMQLMLLEQQSPHYRKRQDLEETKWLEYEIELWRRKLRSES